MMCDGCMFTVHGKYNNGETSSELLGWVLLLHFFSLLLTALYLYNSYKTSKYSRYSFSKYENTVLLSVFPEHFYLDIPVQIMR